HQAQFPVALAGEPLQASPDVQNSLRVGFKCEADMGNDEMVGALVARNHAAVVIRHRQAQRGNSPAIEPQANFHLYIPLGVPLREHNNRGTGLARHKKPRVDTIILRPARVYGAAESENAIAERAIFGRAQGVVARRIRFEPFLAMWQGVRNPIAQKYAGFGIIHSSADVLEPPTEWAHTAIVVRGPATMLVSADSLLEPEHSETGNLTQRTQRHRAQREKQARFMRSEEHTSELQSRGHLVCRLLLEKKKKYNHKLLVTFSYYPQTHNHPRTYICHHSRPTLILFHFNIFGILSIDVRD